jgi:indolepyruvate ferredoxin oxidoreductase alpha subunit
MLEPSDSQETRELTRIAFDLSEEYDTPVLLRLTTRICHSKGVVEVGPRVEHPPRGYSPQSEKRSLLPSNARRRHVFVEERTLKLRELTERFPYNRLEPGDPAVGIVSCGVAYQYAREVFPRATFLKLSLTWPLPVKLVKQFARKVKKIYVIEEGDPILENHLRQLGLKVTGKDRLPLLGEFSPSVVARAFGKKVRLAQRPEKPHIPLRPPVLCPGCGHRGVFYEIAKLKLRAMGDIGCYTLGAYPPLNAMDTCLCMGASLGNTLGLEKALGPDIEGRAVAVIGDSTFYHSGITPLIDIVYNKGKSTVVILDNQITAMTGHQHHPGSGKTLQGQPAPVVDLEALCRAVGVKHVRVVDPYDLPAVEAALREEVKRPEPSVIIARRPCVLMERRPPAPFAVLAEKCNACKLCLRVGCPAISLKDSLAVIDPLYCKGCAVCHQVCQKEAIVPA